jgi:hypothetical protein
MVLTVYPACGIRADTTAGTKQMFNSLSKVSHD